MVFFYHWWGISSYGDTVSGTISAHDITSAREKLAERVLCLTEIRPTMGSAIVMYWQQLPVLIFSLSDADLAFFCKQLQSLLASNIPLDKSVKLLEMHSKSAVLRVIMKYFHADLVRGKLFSQAVREQAHFPPFIAELITAAEQSDALPRLLGHAAYFLGNRARYIDQFRRLLLLPLITGAIGCIVIGILMHTVVPVLESLLQGGELSQGVELSKALVHWAMAWGLESLFVFLGTVLLFQYISMSVLPLRIGRDFLLYRLPVVGSLYYLADNITFLSCLRILVAANIPLAQALSLAAHATDNQYFCLLSKKIGDQLAVGLDLGSVLQQCNFFPQAWVSLLAIAQEKKDVESSCYEIALLLDCELQGRVETVFTLIPIIFLAVIGISVGSVVMLLYEPIVSLLQKM